MFSGLPYCVTVNEVFVVFIVYLSNVNAGVIFVI